MPKIFGIGLSRTGTTSCCAFFKQLGITARHLPLSMSDIDKHTFSNDTSVSVRFEELHRLYPNSKFIYTTRVPNKWVSSCLKWVKLETRKAWYFNLPDDGVRKWVSDNDLKLYGRTYLDMAEITREELLKANRRHDRRVREYFKDRPDDILVVDVTDCRSLPFSKLLNFLERHGLYQGPSTNRLPDLDPLSQNAVKGNTPPQDGRKNQSIIDTEFSAKVQFRLADIWHQKGKLERAISGYKKALAIDPGHVPARLGLGDLLCKKGHFADAIKVYQAGLEVDHNEARFHKALVNTYTASENLDGAFSHYRLERKDGKKADIRPDDILCCVVERNESDRLPYFLSYYRQKGVSKFFFVDNDSTDGSLAYLLKQPDVYTWHSSYSFNKANFGSAWFELLLRKYGEDHWCVIVDVDEILCYPDWENKTIVQLCRELDKAGKRAMNGVLLDMYSDKPVKDTHYSPGTPYLRICNYFDKKFFHVKYKTAGPYRNQDCFFGGVRQRVFGDSGAYYLSKVPLLKYNADFILAGGQHWTNRPNSEIADQRACLLHFKYFSTFHEYVSQEVERKEHFGEAMQYAEYAKLLAGNKALSFFDPNHSLKFENSRQLIDLGIMSEGKKEKDGPLATFPVIPSPPFKGIRPLWSVKLTIYDRLDYIERALRSVIDQSPGPKEMDIEVVVDGSNPRIQDDIKRIVDAVAGSRVQIYQHPKNAGHPDIFNICIQRARGHWIHILHDDDWIQNGFYEKLSRGIKEAPDIGAAFCRHAHTDEHGNPRLTSRMERKTPGILDNWLEQIAVVCRIQFSSIVVKREAYEQLGGFCRQANSAFDWEMWTRLATRYPVWYEPSLLACAGKDGKAETDRLRKSGKQIADARNVIEIFRTYLPGELNTKLPKKALEHYAAYALHLAKQYLQQSDPEAALANIREGLECSRSKEVTAALVALLRMY